MSASALISGTLFERQSSASPKAASRFGRATLRVKDGDATAWWKLLVFSESAGAELMRLGDGDAVSAQGSFKCEPYDDKDGERACGLHDIRRPHAAAEAGAARAQAEARPPRESWAAPDRLRDDRPRVDDDLNDHVPF